MLQTARLPYVRFTSEAVSYKDAEGHIGFRDVYYANITPAGGRDETVKVAEDWIKELREKASSRGPFDSAASEYDTWHTTFSKMFEQYKAGLEMTTGGTPLRGSLAFTKAEIAQCESVKLFSFEDVAGCNEEAMQRMGIGARALKQKAQALLDSQASNHLAQENAALRLTVDELTARVDALSAAAAAAPTTTRRTRSTAPADEQEASA